jgi:hypothetical protein
MTSPLEQLKQDLARIGKTPEEVAKLVQEHEAAAEKAVQEFNEQQQQKRQARGF